MDETQFETLCAAADAGSGVSMAGFEAGHDPDEDAYWLVTPETERSGLSESAFRDAALANDAYVTNWYFWTEVAPDSAPRQAYLQWLEGDDEVPARYDRLREGVTRTWGQLRVTVTLGIDGVREYEIRHEEDAGVDAAALAVHEDPLDAREVSKYDDRGRYRPLRTAPSLQTGWVFAGLDATEVCETVEHLYPATIVNWYREREGDLDVTDWRAHVERQSGIYGLIQTWDRQNGHEHVEWVAEACCVDSQCVKRREWDYDEDTDLETPRGDGEFPCREPCSVVTAAARQWTKLEGEEPRTYEFDLTPSEKEQLEAIVDAVADGEIDDIREADVYEGANRYRTRFLRAKLFDEDGNLCGVETDRDDGDD